MSETMSSSASPEELRRQQMMRLAEGLRRDVPKSAEPSPSSDPALDEIKKRFGTDKVAEAAKIEAKQTGEQYEAVLARLKTTEEAKNFRARVESYKRVGRDAAVAGGRDIEAKELAQVEKEQEKAAFEQRVKALLDNPEELNQLMIEQTSPSGKSMYSPEVATASQLRLRSLLKQEEEAKERAATLKPRAGTIDVPDTKPAKLQSSMFGRLAKWLRG